MLTESFDPVSREIIRAEEAVPGRERALARAFPLDTFLLTFSGGLTAALLEAGRIEQLDEHLTLGSAAYRSPICRVKGTSCGFVLSGVGAPLAAAALEELAALFPARRFVLFGSCGALTALPPGRLIVPTAACRDEGTSFHYAPPGDYIPIQNAPTVERILRELEIPYVSGKTWTTDAFYRETERNRARRVREGCLCVEMECSAAQAVCDLRGLALYPFFYAADSLEGSWARRILGDGETDTRLKYFEVACAIAARVKEEEI